MMPSPLPHWLQSVFHSGAQPYVSNLYPKLGDTVTLRVRVHSDAPVRQLYLRTFPDGEQLFTRMRKAEDAPPASWWQVELEIGEPQVHYRFIMESADGVFWYTALGSAEHEPSDTTDFRIIADYEPPGWVHDAVFYQIFPDRFANGDPSTDPQPHEYDYRGMRPHTYPWGTPPPAKAWSPVNFYGGDLPGITAHLDHLTRLGVNTLYLNPIFTALSNHKYDVGDYDHVDPHFGGDQALIDLRRALTERDMRYMLDIVPNHCGYASKWFQAAQADFNAPETEFFIFHDHPDDYEAWLGVWSLPKLNYESLELRRRIYGNDDAVFRKWLKAPFSADGWRIDVANMLGRQGAVQLGVQIARDIRSAVKTARPDAYLLGENFYDAAPQLQGDQWDAVMNYYGFTHPLWFWLSHYERASYKLNGKILSDGPSTTTAMTTSWLARLASYPWQIALQQFNLLGSHDTPRIRSVVGENDALHRLATVLLFTFPGVPSVYYGDEIGLTDDDYLRSRGCMNWDEATWDGDLFAFHQQLITFRRRSKALQFGSFQLLHVDEDCVAFQREWERERVLVVANRGTESAEAIPVAHGGIPDNTVFRDFVGGQEATMSNGQLILPATGQGATLWQQTA
ncbi:MAG: alpha-amylase family glycosyl hydrolase [Anaerolineae bacterium]|nr:alpha-amylase family glycosyl hydrolase [Anaerolineae bacterium]